MYYKSFLSDLSINDIIQPSNNWIIDIQAGIQSRVSGFGNSQVSYLYDYCYLFFYTLEAFDWLFNW